MTVQELYEKISGSYDSAKKILSMDRMITRFVQRFPADKSCERLVNGWEQGDTVEIFEGAHALKGVCANLGFDELSRMASEISEEFRPGHVRAMSEEEVASRMEAIRALYNKTIAGIQQFVAEQ